MGNKAPPFATIQSLLAVRALATKDEPGHRITQKAIQSIHQPGLSMGMGAEHLCAELLPGFTSDELLCKHSQFQLYASFMKPAHRAFWARGFKQGSLRAQELHSQIEAVGTIEDGALRACKHCAFGDFMTYGTSFWRVFHQWSFLEHCPIHGCNLHSRCCKCDAPYLRSQVLRAPQDPCESCGMQLFDWLPQNRPPGYLALTSEFMSRLHHGASPTDGNAHWRDRVDDRTEIERAWAHLESAQLLQAWGCGAAPELAAALQCDIRAEPGVLHRQAFGALPTILTAALQCALPLLSGSRPALISEADNMHTQRSAARRKFPSYIRGERPRLKMVRSGDSSCGTQEEAPGHRP